MIGIVEVFYGNEKVAEEENMILDQLGEVIATFMSLPRGLSNIESASAILDASNYTIRAASLGKDALGYQHHAHFQGLSALNSSGNVYRVISFQDNSVSSYHTSAVYQERFLKLLPEFSKPTMTRLESTSTKVSYLPSSLDMGHNLNLMPSGGLSSCLGCYAPTGSFQIFYLGIPSDLTNITDDNIICSGLFNNVSGFNAYQSIDSRGFITMQSSSLVEGKNLEAAGIYPGLLLTHSTGWDAANADFNVKYLLNINSKDFICLNIFGGIYNIGLWCYDIGAMMRKGMYPPFSQYDKEELEYKLVARKTFTKDLTYQQDYGLPGILASEDLKLVWTWRFK